ncbi:MAG TPA: chemotaxis protein CheW [Myxococcota bacterium]|nr:chemotaxis protein CheW [Myxococcota bacterium]
MESRAPLMLLFRIGEGRYAVRCTRVECVLSRPRLHQLLGPPGAVVGSFPYRDALTPVIDVCKLFLGAPCPDRISSRIVVVRASERVVGLLVERATDTRALPGETLAPGARSDAIVTGIVDEGGELQQIVDVDALVARGFAS